MAILKKQWSSIYYHDWDDDSWTTGTPTTATETLSGTTMVYTGAIDLVTNGEEGVQITINLIYDTTPTDEIVIGFYSSYDGTNWDEKLVYGLYGDNTQSPHQFTVIIKDLSYIRVGLAQSGTTDSHEINSVVFRGWRWETI